MRRLWNPSMESWPVDPGCTVVVYLNAEERVFVKEVSVTAEPGTSFEVHELEVAREGLLVPDSKIPLESFKNPFPVHGLYCPAGGQVRIELKNVGKKPGKVVFSVLGTCVDEG